MSTPSLNIFTFSGELVEYCVGSGNDGKLRAEKVTGPNGNYCQGAPPQGSGHDKRPGGGQGSHAQIRQSGRYHRGAYGYTGGHRRVS